MRILKLTVTFICLFILFCFSHGQSVKSVRIGSQVWMVENLNVSTFRNGDPIPEAKTNEEWKKAGKEKKPAWCYYDNKTENGNVYGKLYNWWAVIDPRGLAPEDWRIPRFKDWKVLINWIGSNISGDNLRGFHSTNSGYELKEEGTKHWRISNKHVTNSSGFTALPGGYRDNRGNFKRIYQHAVFWSTDIPSSDAYEVWLSATSGGATINLILGSKRKGYSVRCLKEW